jgi:hypothetical protein
MLMEQRWTAYTLEDPKTKLTYSGPGKKTCSDCSTVFCFDVTPWKNVPESSRLNLIWGYDKSGKPIQQGWFWGRDYDSKEKTGKVPPASLSDLMFDIHDDTENVDLSPPIFWWQKNAARRFHCDGSQPHDSRTTGKGQ